MRNLIVESEMEYMKYFVYERSYMKFPRTPLEADCLVNIMGLNYEY
jgi:hypothetical protein